MYLFCTCILLNVRMNYRYVRLIFKNKMVFFCIIMFMCDCAVDVICLYNHSIFKINDNFCFQFCSIFIGYTCNWLYRVHNPPQSLSHSCMSKMSLLEQSRQKKEFVHISSKRDSFTNQFRRNVVSGFLWLSTRRMPDRVAFYMCKKHDFCSE